MSAGNMRTKLVSGGGKEEWGLLSNFCISKNDEAKSRAMCSVWHLSVNIASNRTVLHAGLYCP